MTGSFKTPGQKQRNKYAAAVRARGASGHNLWFVTPPQPPQGSLLILNSDVEFEAFLYIEGSPDLLCVDYAPLRLGDVRPSPGPRHLATATTLDGAVLDIDLDPAGGSGPRVGRRLVTLAILDAARTRVQSWRAIVPAINRCRSHELGPLIIRCRHLLERFGEVTADQALQSLESESSALVIGVLATMLRARELESDVDEHLWGPGTRFRRSPYAKA